MVCSASWQYDPARLTRLEGTAQLWPDVATLLRHLGRIDCSSGDFVTMRYLATVMLLIVGIIHLLPLPGVLGGERLAALYGLAFDDPNLAILMRHRAVLFGLLGAFLVFAAFRERLQPLALLAGFISVLSFLGLAWSVGGYNALLARVFVADVVALACLVVGTLAWVLARRREPAIG